MNNAIILKNTSQLSIPPGVLCKYDGASLYYSLIVLSDELQWGDRSTLEQTIWLLQELGCEWRV